MAKPPLLYSFRRCPYAMRARMALVMGEVNVDVREIDLSNKHPIFLKTSPKGTVPVLVLEEGRVIDESLDIISWVSKERLHETFDAHHALIESVHKDFVPHAGHYKYHERYPERTKTDYRDDCLPFIKTLESTLSQKGFISGDTPSLVDLAIFPFVRQFAMVDEEWFEKSPYTHLKKWLTFWHDSNAYKCAMKKFPLWDEGVASCFLLD